MSSCNATRSSALRPLKYFQKTGQAVRGFRGGPEEELDLADLGLGAIFMLSTPAVRLLVTSFGFSFGGCGCEELLGRVAAAETARAPLEVWVTRSGRRRPIAER